MGGRLQHLGEFADAVRSAQRRRLLCPQPREIASLERGAKYPRMNQARVGPADFDFGGWTFTSTSRGSSVMKRKTTPWRLGSARPSVAL